MKIKYYWLAFLVLGLMPLVAHADVPPVNLQPGQRVEFQFNYNGDGSLIQLTLSGTVPDSLVLSIYTPEQVAAMARGENPVAIGQGSVYRDGLRWLGSFRVGGMYHFFVQNKGTAPISFKVELTGSGVGAIAKVESDLPTARVQMAREGSQDVLNVVMPKGLVPATLKLIMPSKPKDCTPVKSIPALITQTTKLCPGETYPPLKIAGNNIGLFTDDLGTATVTSQGRQFAVTMEGSSNWIEGVTIRAQSDPRDTGAWMCLYEQCVLPTKPVSTTVQGGISYGGGILLKGDNTVVHSVTVRGGTIGIATLNARRNYLVENQLSDLGWGVYNFDSEESMFINNNLHRDNHGCTAPDGSKRTGGCETAGWACADCALNIIIGNRCELSGKCYYMNGEQGLASNENKFIANYCAGATESCFEITFSFGNLLQDNVGTRFTDSKAGTETMCKMPYWLGGSISYFQNNRWECTVDANTAFNQSRDSTIIPTNIINLDAIQGVQIPLHTPAAPSATRIPQTPTPAPAVSLPAGFRTSSEDYRWWWYRKPIGQ